MVSCCLFVLLCFITLECYNDILYLFLTNNIVIYGHGVYASWKTTQKELIERERGSGKADGASDVVQYKIDIPANR